MRLLLRTWTIGENCLCTRCGVPIWGRKVRTNREKTLTTYRLRATRVSDPAEVAADMLATGKILGWFQGRMEFGPRALGNRSILADPRNANMNANVNNAVKFREWWRPFAPSLLAEVAGEYLESATESPFMVLTAQVRPKRSVIPSVTHVDGSAPTANCRARCQPTLLAIDSHIWSANRRTRGYKYLLQSARRADRLHPDRCGPDIF